MLSATGLVAEMTRMTSRESLTRIPYTGIDVCPGSGIGARAIEMLIESAVTSAYPFGGTPVQLERVPEEPEVTTDEGEYMLKTYAGLGL